MTFETLHSLPQILHSLKTKGYLTPTPIQEKSIPHILHGKEQRLVGKEQRFLRNEERRANNE